MRISESTWLLTGANGTIGSDLRERLRSKVATLVVGDLTTPTDPAPNERAVSLDLEDPASLEAALQGVGGVLHLAGIPTEAPFEDLLAANVMGTYHLLEAMRTAGVRRIVYASSNHAVGHHPVDELLDENATMRPDGLYGVSKAAAEALTRLYSDAHGFVVCNMRIGTYADRPEHDRAAATWLSPDDAARAFEAAMASDEPYSVIYGVSANLHRYWSLEPGRRIGYVPQDDASELLGADVTPTDALQGGKE